MSAALTAQQDPAFARATRATASAYPPERDGRTPLRVQAERVISYASEGAV